MTRSHQQGFTLIETLVAISVLVVAIVVPLRVISQSTKSAAFTREKIAAIHLAQEGIELMQAAYAVNLNDLNTAWSKWSTLYGATASGFSFEPRTKDLIMCTSVANNPCKIYYDEKGYTHMTAGTKESLYSRAIHVRKNESSPGRVEVESVVTWQTSYGTTGTAARTVWFYNMYE